MGSSGAGSAGSGYTGSATKDPHKVGAAPGTNGQVPDYTAKGGFYDGPEAERRRQQAAQKKP